MKAVFVLVVVAIFGYTALVYFDAVAEQQVYAFCELNSSGNPVAELDSRASEHQFSKTQIDSNTLEFTTDNPLALLNEYVCEVKIADARVVSQSLIKR